MKRKILGMLTLVISSFGLLAGVNAETTTYDSWDALKTCLTIEGDNTCIVGNITDSAEANENVMIKGNKVLDLGGNTLSLANQSRFIVENGISLTISNGTIEKSTRSTTVTVRVGGTFTLNGDARLVSKIDDNVGIIGIFGSSTDDDTKTTVNIEKGAYIKGSVSVDTADVSGEGAHVSYGVTINVHGTIESNIDSNALSINGAVSNSTGNVPVVNIYDGAVITSDGNSAVYAAGYGVWNIMGGTITGREAIDIKAGDIKITGGSLTANGAYVAEPVEESGKAPATGSAISIINGGSSYGGNIKLSIANATVTSEHGYAVYETPGNESVTALTELNILSGNFTGGSEVSNNALKLVSSEASENELFKSFISGGTFTGIVDENYISNGLGQSESGIVGTVYDITSSKTENGEFTVDKHNAVEGEEVTVTYKAKEGYELDKIEVTDENGKTIAVKDGKFKMPASKVTVKATFTKLVTDVQPSEAPATYDNVFGYVLLTLTTLSIVIIVSKKVLKK